MKYLFKVLLASLLVFSGFGGIIVPKTHAATSQTLAINEQLNGWVMDTNNIYAITAAGNLKVISRATFTVTNTLSLGAGVTLSDIALAGNVLYVSIQDQNKIAQIDVSTSTPALTKSFTLTKSPSRIEVVGNNLYYAGEDFSDIGVVDLTSGMETFLNIGGKTFYSPDLVSNSGFLYIAESGLTGSNIYKYSISANSIVSQSTYDSSYGFSYPKRNVIFDNNEIFYAGRSLSADNLGTINGTYRSGPTDETVLSVTTQFVFTNIAIYDRTKFKKVSDLPFETNYVLAPSMSEVYLFDDATMTIHLESYNLPSTLTPQQSTAINQKLTLNNDITDWVLDDANGKIYAISEESNKLLTINTATMEVVNEQLVGSFPSDIDLVDGKLYIADSGSTTITIIDLASGSQTKITTTQNPYRIATDGTVLYYVTEDQWTDVYKVDLVNPSEAVVGAGLQTNQYSFYEPDLEYDGTTKTLYIGESGSTGSNLYALNTADLSLTKTDYNNGSGFSLPARKLIMDGDSFYYAQQQISKTDLTNELFNFNENIISTSTNDVTTTAGIYAKSNTQAKEATFPFDASQALINSAGNVFVFVPGTQSIYKFNSVQEINTLSPANLQVTVDSSNNCQLTWDGTTADSYQVFFQTPGMASPLPLTTNDPTANHLTLMPADYAPWAGQNVTFSVKSVLGTYTSAPITFDYLFKPATPANFLVKKDTSNNLVFSWNPVTAEYYKLYYKTDAMADFLPIDDTQITGTEKSLSETQYQQWVGTTVTFAVQAYVGNKMSDMETYQFLVDGNAAVQDPAPSTGDSTGSQTGTTTPTDGGSSTGVDDPTDLFNLDNAKIVRMISTMMPIYEYKQDVEDVVLNLHESVINEMDQTSDSQFYLETKLGSFKLPIKTIDQYSDNPNSYVQVTIQKVPTDQEQDFEKIAEDNFFNLVTQPVDFSVQIVENGTSTTITSYGDEFVERRIPINDPSDLENMVVVLLDPTTNTFQPVPTKIEQDENGQYWAVFYRNGNSIYALAKAKKKHFTDTEGHWAQNSIDDLASKLIVQGVNDNEFKPEKSVTRAEFVAMLTRALGLASEGDIQDSKFKDISNSSWCKQAVNTAYESGLTKGYQDGTFRPSETISREEMAVLAARALQMVNGDQQADPNLLSDFSDVNKVGAWAQKGLSIAIEKGLINGRTSTTLAPQVTVTRAEAAVVIDRLLKALKFSSQ